MMREALVADPNPKPQNQKPKLSEDTFKQKQQKRIKLQTKPLLRSPLYHAMSKEMT